VDGPWKWLNWDKIQIDRYNEDGFLIVDKLVDQEFRRSVNINLGGHCGDRDVHAAFGS
jgi:hypothetical protein